MAARTRQLVDAALTIRPANEASWDDLQKILGSTAPANCQCQRYKMRPKECFVSFPAEERADRLRIQTDPGCADAEATTGLVAYLDDEPVGWCAVEPRIAYIGLVRGGRVAWTGRSEDRTDDSVWAVTCSSPVPGSVGAASALRLPAPRSTTPGTTARGPSRAIRSRQRKSSWTSCTSAPREHSPPPASPKSPDPRRAASSCASASDPGDRPEKRGQWSETAVTDTAAGAVQRGDLRRPCPLRPSI